MSNAKFYFKVCCIPTSILIALEVLKYVSFFIYVQLFKLQVVSILGKFFICFGQAETLQELINASKLRIETASHMEQAIPKHPRAGTN